MRLTVLGSSPAWPNPKSAHAGYLLEDGGKRLLLDCGPGVLGRLRELDLLPVDAVAITHFHLDHWGDLVPWVWFTEYWAPTHEKPILWLPPDGRRELATFGLHWGRETMFDVPFECREFRPREAFDAGGFSLAAVPVEHYGLSAFGFRVTAPSGPVLAYSGDSAPCPGLAELAEGSDLFLCEATLRSGDADGETRGHLSAEEALAVGARRTLLTHRPVELSTPAGVERASDGLVLEL